MKKTKNGLVPVLLDGLSPRSRFYAKKLAKRTVTPKVKVKLVEIQGGEHAEGMVEEEWEGAGTSRKRRLDDEAVEERPRTRRRIASDVVSPPTRTNDKGKGKVEMVDKGKSRKRRLAHEGEETLQTPPSKRPQLHTTPRPGPAEPPGLPTPALRQRILSKYTHTRTSSNTAQSRDAYRTPSPTFASTSVLDEETPMIGTGEARGNIAPITEREPRTPSPPAPPRSILRKRNRAITEDVAAEPEDEDEPRTPSPKRARISGPGSNSNSLFSAFSTPISRTPASPSPIRPLRRTTAMPLINPTRFPDPRTPPKRLGRDMHVVQASPTGVPEIRPPEYLNREWREERARMRRREPGMLNYWALEGTL